MKKSKQLASLALAVVAFAGTSAFAESRHSNETRSREARGQVTVEGRRPARSNERRESSRYRSSDRYRNDHRYKNDHRFRNDGRFEPGRGRYGYRSSEPYYAHGRISRCERYGRGYRVWVGGAPYPFYVPLAYWSRDRFRVGMTIGLGGYYNPLGYYDYWDGYRDGYSNRGYRGHSTPDFAGVVERVDYRRDTFIVRDDDTGDFITVVMRDRRESLPRVGDYVAVRGDWTTRGYFRAYDIDFLD